MVSLQIVPYILSKIWSVLVSLYQAAVSYCSRNWLDIPGGLEVAIGLYITLFLATLAGMMMGLLVSAVSPNQNSTAHPISSLPQITFGGGLCQQMHWGCRARLCQVTLK